MSNLALATEERFAGNDNQPSMGHNELTVRLGILAHDVVIITFLLKAKATVASHNHHRIPYLILHADCIHEQIEIAVNITRDYDTLSLRK